MKKLFIVLFVFIFISIGALYVVLFTKSGNYYLANYIERTINNKQNDFILEIDELIINHNLLVFQASLNEKSKIEIKAIFSIFDQIADVEYKADIENLSIFNNLAQMDLNGDLKVFGEVKHQDKITTISGKSNIAKSKTEYEIILEDFLLNKVKVNILNAKIDDILAIVKQPIYTSGNINLSSDLTYNSSKFFDGLVKIDIKNAKLNNKVIEQEFKQIIKQDINYSLHMENILKDSLINSKISFLSNLANIYTKKMIFDTKSFLLKSDYKLSVSDLSKLDDFTIIPLSGNIVLDGNIFKDNSSLKVDGFSDLIGGKFKLNLLNNDLNINIDGANSRKLLNMINKNEFFDSKIDLDLKYNLISSYGNLNAKIEDGHFVKTKLTQKIYDLSKIDITKEIYKEGILKSEIKDDKLLSDFHIKADKSIIDSKNGIMDFRKNEIDTKLNVNFNKINFAILLSGNIDNPDYKFDIKDILKDTIKKNINNEKIDKKINRILEKNGVDENKDVQNIIKYLF
ncbi:hypothetical protein AAX26_02010 [Aliarcobacter thereius]|uniref:Uncharacterized protein n=2 Tax=Aliarcobacter thereius TaxID=544718 RepID=A0A1C0B2M2_9BACT|nr:hypothetical protein [Aliarcobacter thereius]OCL85373.1 hypothetical protein AAX26_02010 [Aliarcobacter thereius]OCL89649.1 hypothetical protein AAX25_01990 [Aliarcobacter thereius]OCL95579.1 hypothetical protein AA347_01051 [Aliarcobacter thereius LMG 24486]OCL96527.1 hypothetical protein AAX29_02066 [Aliarcobacter thereius]QBF16436.1 hypothetical protein ATH_1396 [Aliarcobacter thereius LMG 24486]